MTVSGKAGRQEGRKAEFVFSLFPREVSLSESSLSSALPLLWEAFGEFRLLLCEVTDSSPANSWESHAGLIGAICFQVVIPYKSKYA